MGQLRVPDARSRAGEEKVAAAWPGRAERHFVNAFVDELGPPLLLPPAGRLEQQEQQRPEIGHQTGLIGVEQADTKQKLFFDELSCFALHGDDVEVHCGSPLVTERARHWFSREPCRRTHAPPPALPTNALA